MKIIWLIIQWGILRPVMALFSVSIGIGAWVFRMLWDWDIKAANTAFTELLSMSRDMFRKDTFKGLTDL